MKEYFKKLLRQFAEFWEKIDLNHKLTIILLGTILVVGVLSLIYYSSKPKYSLLYDELDAESASLIKEYLDDEKIPYRLKKGGKAIYIPKNKVYAVRISLAGKGIPKKGHTVGFEIFDKTNLGMTEFVQKVNFYRAIQGELARTISSIDGVESARVHIVIPEESIFKEDQKEPSASIALKLRAPGILDATQIAGIKQLVASSVEGLKPNKISIIDNWGNVLARPVSEDGSASEEATTHIALQKAVENHYVKKIQSLLEGVLGKNNAVVRVNAELNFDRIEKTMETYNPESAVVRKEVITTESSSGKSATAKGAPGVQTNLKNEKSVSGRQEESSTSREIVKNEYEIDKTVQHIVQGVGEIKSLTASVFIRQKVEKGKDGKLKPVPRSAEEMATFEEIVKNALGFDPKRGDRVTVKEIVFNVPEVPEIVKELNKQVKREKLMSMIKTISGSLAIILLAVFAFILFKKVKVEEVAVAPAEMEIEGERPVAPEGAAAESAAPAGEAHEEVAKRAFIESDVANIVEQQPEEAALVIKKWIEQQS